MPKQVLARLQKASTHLFDFGLVEGYYESGVLKGGYVGAVLPGLWIWNERDNTCKSLCARGVRLPGLRPYRSSKRHSSCWHW